MNTQRILLLALTVYFAIPIPGDLIQPVFSAETKEKETEVLVLEGLKGVSVEVVQPISGFEDKQRLNPVKVDELHVTVEKLLTEEGIEVLDDTSDDPNVGHVAVTINVGKTRLAINFIVQVKVKLYQQAILVRNTRLQISTPTWPLGTKAQEARKPVIVRKHEIAPTVRNRIETQLKMLIGDYLEANPLPEPKPDISGMMTGTILFTRTEGCYNIFADNGVEYHPVNLPRQHKHHGLRIAFRAVRTDRAGIPYPGVWIKLTRIVILRREK